MNRDYDRYNHSIGMNCHHLEWCSKYRYKMLGKEKYKAMCEEILREIAQRHKIEIIEMTVMPEHIHIFVNLPPDMSQSKAQQLFKGGASRQLFLRQPKFGLRYPIRRNGKRHFWSPGKFCGSVGNATFDVVQDYVKNQEMHHADYQSRLGDF